MNHPTPGSHVSTVRVGAILFLIAMAVVGSAGESVAEEEKLKEKLNKKPNVLFILADDWGWGDLSRHGSSGVRTPHLDELFEQGTEFRQFHVNSPVCSASRAAFYTGQFPGRNKVFWIYDSTIEKNRGHGMNDWLDPTLVMLPRLMKKAGYVTGHYGKWHLTNGQAVRAAPSLDQYGIDESACWNGLAPGVRARGEAVFKLAKDFIRRHRERPFFLNLWLRETHTPHWVDGEDLKLSWIQELPKDERIYAAVAWAADQQIGQILQLLKELDLEKNTIVVFTSDNGPEETGPPIRRINRMLNTARRRSAVDFVFRNVEEFGFGTYYSRGTTSGQKGKKRSTFGGGVRTPFLIRWPGRVAAGRVDQTTVISAVDLLPTLCEIAAVSLPKGYRPDGENILPALMGRPFRRANPLFWENHICDHSHTWPELAVLHGRWKLLMTKNGGRMELYDVIADWGETNNLADQSPGIVRRLKKMARQYNQSLPSTTEFDARLCVPGSVKQ